MPVDDPMDLCIICIFMSFYSLILCVSLFDTFSSLVVLARFCLVCGLATFYVSLCDLLVLLASCVFATCDRLAVFLFVCESHELHTMLCCLVSSIGFRLVH